MIQQPNYTALPDDDKCCLLDDYEVTACGHKVVVPEFFMWDGASVPRVFWRFQTPFAPKVIAAALVHDWLHYTAHLPKETADRIFYELLLLNGVNPVKAKLMHQAVKFGGGNYGKLTKEKQRVLAIMLPLIKKSPRVDEYHFPG